MKPVFFLAATLSIIAVTLVYTIYSAPESAPEATTFGAVPEYDYLSPEGRIIRYLAKMELNKNNPVWAKDKNVVKVMNPDGTVNLEAAKSHFIGEGILTPEEWDAALATIKGNGYTQAGADKASQKALLMYTALEEKRVKDVADKNTIPEPSATSTPR